MLKQRILTVAILLPLFVAALFLLPNLYWAILLLLVLAMGAWEWATLSAFSAASKALYVLFIALSCVLLLTLEPSAFFPGVPQYYLHLLSLAFWILIAPGWLRKKWNMQKSWLIGLVGWVVLVPMWHALVRLQENPWWLLFLLSLIWVADTAAYFCGKTFGKHKLAPKISPGKTWEGVIGAFTIVLIYFFAVALAFGGVEQDKLMIGAVCVVIMVALSIVGDLFESLLKRQAGVKDSSGLLPGHGGVLDRIDGLTASIPAALLMLIYLSILV